MGERNNNIRGSLPFLNGRIIKQLNIFKQIVFCIIGLLFVGAIYAQERTLTPQEMDAKLDSISNVQFNLDNKVQLNVSNIQMVDLLSSIGLENNLNLSVDPNLIQPVTYNFYDAKVKDVFSFLYRNYDITINFVGSILIFKKIPEPKEIKAKYSPEQPIVEFKSDNRFLSLDLSDDTLKYVVHEIMKLSNENIVLASDIKDKKVSGYFLNRPFEQVLEMLSSANDLEISKDESGIYFLKPLVAETNSNTIKRGTRNRGVTSNQPPQNNGLEVESSGNGLISIKAKDVAIRDVIEMAAQVLNEHYFMYAYPEEKITLSVRNISFEDLIRKLLNGTTFSYREENRVLFIGQQGSEGLRSTELVKLEYRTIENVVEMIPKELSSGLEMYEFIELNGLVVSGSSRRIQELKSFLHSIDEVVPMVQIDVIILFTQRGSNLATGIKAALDASQQNTGGTIYPDFEMNLNSVTVNSIIDALNGFGNLNLGQVTSDFFLAIQALESNNVVKTESTPKISTLNGHEASISIGEQRYYQEERVQVSNVVGNANVQSSRIWKSIEASLEVNIKPFVSSDEHVTLEISVGQNDFGEQVDPTAPPNKTTQTFQSFVRVKNGEVILMGGLERKSSRDTGAGVPVLSRIPIIKWFLSSRTKAREKSKLHILIRPTVTY
jgi:type IV pilus assembly protein PilQ